MNSAGFFRDCYERLRACWGKGVESGNPMRSTQPILAPAVAVQTEFEKALTFHQQGKLDAAKSIYSLLLQQQSDHGGALHYLAVLYAQRGNLNDAIELINRAVEIDPDNATVHSNRGNVLKALHRLEDALDSYNRALALAPENVEALNNRGAVFGDLGRHEEALVSYSRALAITSEHAAALFNRGVSLAALGRYQQAWASYDCAIAVNPGYAEAFNNRGTLFETLERNNEALASYDSALEIRPDYADALNNRGSLLRQMGQIPKAAQDFARLVEVEPDYEYALGNKLYTHLQVCHWDGYHNDLKRCISAVRDNKRACLPFAILGVSATAEDYLTCARTFVTHKFPIEAQPLWIEGRDQHDRIRLAYLSADFQHHATAYLMAELFEKHDRNKFAVSAWSFGPHVEDDMRARLRKAFDQFKEVRVNSDFEIATMLRAQEIDIAIDLKGFTQYCRPGIFAHRAAPIQVNYLGYPGAMGAAYIDYIIGDAVVTPFEHEAFYDEKVVRLPDTYQANDTKRVIAEHTPSRSEVHLPGSGFVFCCFNNNFKITPDFFDIWMRLLKRVEGSVLWLLEDNAAASHNLQIAAEARGVRAERLVFATRMPLPNHLARHRVADLFLDTLPYNAHTTASDALWAGLPVLTCLGSAFQGRVAASLLSAAGLFELVTDNLADYEALALKLASTPTMLNEIKAKLARNRATHPLFDIDRFTRHIESAYTSMYERHLRGEKPQGFSVKSLPLTRIR